MQQEKPTSSVIKEAYEMHSKAGDTKKNALGTLDSRSKLSQKSHQLSAKAHSLSIRAGDKSKKKKKNLPLIFIGLVHSQNKPDSGSEASEEAPTSEAMGKSIRLYINK